MSSSERPFDFIVIGAGSAGAVIASRLTEDPAVRVCLIEAGGPPPPHEAMPAAVAMLQNDPTTDWMYDGSPGGIGKGIVDGRMMVPRGRMLGGSSSLNYMAYVRGHPGDFDAWAQGGATGWSYAAVLPYFMKSEGLTPSDHIVIDADAHNTEGPLGVSVRSPVLQGAVQFVQAAEAAGIPRGDYNGRDRGGAAGVSSLFQTTTRGGKRSSTFQAYLVPNLDRANLTVVTHALVEKVLLDGAGTELRATGVRYRNADGQVVDVHANREVIVSGGAVGSPQILMLSGIGPADALAAVGVDCVLDLPGVGQHLKDHLHVGLFYDADGIGESMVQVAISLGPDALRDPAGPLPADPAHDAVLPPELAGLKAEAERRLMLWATTGEGIASSSLYDATTFFNTGLGDAHTHDAQVAFLTCGYTPGIWRDVFRVPETYFADAAAQLDVNKGVVVLLPNLVQPHSEGSITLASSNPADKPIIDLNYFDDPHDVKVMVAAMRRGLEIAAAWPGEGLGPLMVPPHLADAHHYDAAEGPSDALLEDMARHYALTVYHLVSTCRMGDVVDPSLKVFGVSGLRVADGSVMPNIVSGNTNAACIMIGEKAAELIAKEHGVALQQRVG